MSPRFIILSTALLLPLAQPLAGADELHVPGDYPTIQAAIDAASDGDEVVIAPGTYRESIEIDASAITLRSTDPDDPEVVAATVLSGDIDDDSVGDVTIISVFDASTAPTRIVGLTIRDGQGPDPIDPGGIYAQGAVLNVTDCVFFGHRSELLGGAVRATLSELKFKRCLFEDNIVGDGGGGAVYTTASSTLFRDTVFRANHAREGGAVAISFSNDAAFERCHFEGNTSESAGGAVLLSASDGITMHDCTFVNNTCEGEGGAIVYHFGDFDLRGSTFRGNTAGGAGAIHFYAKQDEITIADCLFEANEARNAGAIRAVSSTEDACVTIERCEFRSNTALSEGGALYATGIGTGHYPSLDLRNSSFISNSVRARGGAISWTADDTIRIDGCSFIANSATINSVGGAATIVAEHIVISNTLFAGNSATQFGGGAQIGFGTDASISNITVIDNSSGPSDSTIHINREVTMANSIFWGNTSRALHDPTTPIADSIVEGGHTGTGILDADPMFTDPDGPDDDPLTYEDNDYTLAPGSPAIDAGDTNALPADFADLDDDGDLAEPVPFDLAGNPRAVEDPSTPNTGIGSPPIDMGAFEFQPACPADIDGDSDADIDDIDLFVTRFLDGVPANADIDGDGDEDIDDIAAFVDAFILGCP